MTAIRKAVILGHRDGEKYEDRLVLKYTQDEKEQQAMDDIETHPDGWTVGDCFWMYELSYFLSDMTMYKKLMNALI